MPSRTEELAERARKVLVGGVNSPVRAKVKPYPLVVAYGRGSRVWDHDGNSYIDFILGYGPLVLGHANKTVAEAVSQVLEEGWLFGATTRHEILLAEKILGHVRPGGKIRFVNSGTEATMTAIRLARGYTNRKYIVKFEGCYHGAHDSVLVKAGSAAADTGAPVSPGVPEEAARLTLVARYNDPYSVEEVFRRHGDNIAAVIVEPVLGNYGVIPGSREFLATLRKLTREYGSLLIFDEVITGFRLSLGGAQEYYGIRADLVTLGKIIGGGFPIGAVVGDRDIMSNLAPEGKVFNAGTFNGHPASMAAGLATISVLEKGGLERIHANSRLLCDILKEACGRAQVSCAVNCAPGMAQFFPHATNVERPEDIPPKAPSTYYKIHEDLLRRGVLIPPSQMEALFVSTEHSRDEISILDVLAELVGGTG